MIYTAIGLDVYFEEIGKLEVLERLKKDAVAWQDISSAITDILFNVDLSDNMDGSELSDRIIAIVHDGDVYLGMENEKEMMKKSIESMKEKR